MMSDLSLRPIHYASVSGGKDSLYMLGLILKNLNKYPLDAVVHFELEIDWDWVKPVIDRMEEMCKSAGIPFYRIKPRQSWYDLYEKFNMPTGVVRWCNKDYKMDCKKQLAEWCKSQNARPIAYIGLCADETKRFKYRVGDDWELGDMCYPLAEEGINEDVILEWAKDNPIFSDWYKYFTRQGCKFCPMLSMKEMAYLLTYYPQDYEEHFKRIYHYEETFNKPYFYGKSWAKDIDYRVRHKWYQILQDEINYQQITLF